jgi:hypothetical protein
VTAPIDIFRAEANGSVFWIGTAKSVADAKACIQSQPTVSSGEYLLFNQLTGSKLILKLNDTNASLSR